MGVEYYIINRKNKTAYDLGKGNWYALNHDKQCFQDLDYLINYIITECYGRVLEKENSNYSEEENSNYSEEENSNYSEEEKIELKSYIVNRIALDLFDFCKETDPKDIFIFNDSGDDITICRSLGYKFVGHRYNKKGDDDYLDYLENHLNRHFKNSNPKHWYNSEDYKNYPEYEIYKTQ